MGRYFADNTQGKVQLTGLIRIQPMIVHIFDIKLLKPIMNCLQ